MENKNRMTETEVNSLLRQIINSKMSINDKESLQKALSDAYYGKSKVHSVLDYVT